MILFLIGLGLAIIILFLYCSLRLASNCDDEKDM